MTDIEEKALALVREVLAERDLSDKRAVRREVSPYTEALCRAIERHEAFKQEVSDAVECYLDGPPRERYFIRDTLRSLIIPKPKPDPLVEVLADTYGASLVNANDLRAALEAHGLEIREKGQ